MKWSLNFGKIAGIKVQMHWTFLLLIAWIVISESSQGSSTETILWTVGYVLTIFICVILHEFGHALTARKYGIKTRSVTLLPIGGLANIEQFPEDPKKEFWIAVAGPAVNVVIAAILLLVAPFTWADLSNKDMLMSLQSIGPGNFLFALCFVNIFLVLFNAIPAFPMDGGRVLRALLSFKLDRADATNVAAKIGQFVGVGFILLGFFGNLLLVLIGLFVIAGAYSENTAVKQMELLKGSKVKDAMMTQYTVLKPDDTLSVAVDKLLSGSENSFVVSENDEIVGVLSKNSLVDGLKATGKDTKISQVMNEKVKTLKSSDKLTDIYMKLQRQFKKQSIFPVREENKLIGVIDMENLQEYIMVNSAQS